MAESCVTDAEILRQIRSARARAAHSIRSKPHASSVRYDPATRTVCVGLMNGASFTLPVDVIPGLQGASDHELADVWVSRADPGVHWETLEVDFEVFALVKTILDTGTLVRAVKPAAKRVVTRDKTTASRQKSTPGTAPVGRSRKSGSTKQPAAKRG